MRRGPHETFVKMLTDDCIERSSLISIHKWGSYVLSRDDDEFSILFNFSPAIPEPDTCEIVVQSGESRICLIRNATQAQTLRLLFVLGIDHFPEHSKKLLQRLFDQKY